MKIRSTLFAAALSALLIVPALAILHARFRFAHRTAISLNPFDWLRALRMRSSAAASPMRRFSSAWSDERFNSGGQIPDRFIEHGSREDCLAAAGLDLASVESAIVRWWQGMKRFAVGG